VRREVLQRGQGEFVRSSLGWEVESHDRHKIRYRDESVEVTIDQEYGDSATLLYPGSMKVLRGDVNSGNELIIIDRVVRAIYEFGEVQVKVLRTGRGWARVGPDVAVDLDASVYRTVSLDQTSVTIREGTRHATVPIERRGSDAYVLRWRQARVKGKWDDNEIELIGVRGLRALGANEIASEG
jgi:hypothetical protein